MKGRVERVSSFSTSYIGADKIVTRHMNVLLERLGEKINAVVSGEF